MLLFVGDASTSTIFGLLALFALPAHVSRHTNQHQHESHTRSGSTWSDYGFLIFLLAWAAIAFVYLQQLSTLALQVKALGFSSAVYGLLISLNGLAVVFLELPISAITQRFSKRRMIALGFGLTGVAPTIPPLAFIVILWTFGEMAQGPISAAYVADLSPAHLQGRYRGATGMTWSIGLILAPLLGTIIYPWNSTLSWLLCRLLAALAALLGPS